VTLREGVYLLIIVALGIQAGRDMLALHRWRPSLFRGGPVVFRRTKTLAAVPQAIPMPPLRTGWFYSARYKALGELEVAFTAETFNAPCLLGRLVVEREGPSLTMLGRPQWSFYAIFLVGFSFAGFPWQAMLFVLALIAINLTWEVREFRRVFQAIADEIDDGARA